MEGKGQRPHGLEEADSLLVRRVISRSGRGKVFINGNLATLAMLSETGETLLTLYGQHEHQSLQRVETHIDLLDEFGGLSELKKEFQEQFAKYTALSEEVERIQRGRELRAKEQELMAFQSREIETSGIRAGEEEALKEEKNILAYARKLEGFASSAVGSLYSDTGSVIEKIQTIISQGKEVLAIDPSLSHLFKSLEAALIQLEDIVLALRDYSKRIEIDPMRLEGIEERLEEIDRLKRKYGPTIEKIFLFKERVDQALQSYTSDEERLSELEGLLEPLRTQVMSLAGKLSEGRKKAASDLKRAIERELGSLGMKKTTFEALVQDLPLSQKGTDRVEFLISPNVGEAVKPLAKIASGGELSRIMLAMKRILAEVGGMQVLVFDEVDSGIGGGTAEVVGRKLKELSKHHQVICVTHLPQIACFADQHYSVKKEVRAGRTVTEVDHLGQGMIVDEIARMLGGMKITEKTRAHAREMIESARKS